MTLNFRLFLIAIAIFGLVFGVPLAALAATNQAVLAWGYDMTAYPTATFNAYQGVKGQPKTQVATGLTALTTTISTGLLTGKTYCFEVTAVVDGTESAPSNEACKTFPQAPSTLTAK